MAFLVGKKKLSTDTLRTYPGFEMATDEVLADMIRVGRHKKLLAHQIMCSQGEKCQGFPLVLSGRVRVHAVGQNGREITLYRLRPGDSCILAISLILSHRLSPAYVEAETDAEVMQIPVEIFRTWFDKVPFWRMFVFGQLSDRLVDVIDMTNDTVFRRLDARIASYLLDAPSRVGATLRTTHQDIASEVGSSREVVSRMLKVFENDGLLRLGRGLIHLLDQEAVAARARAAGMAEMSRTAVGT